MQDQRRIRSAFRNPARIICPRCKLVDSIMQQKGGKPAPRRRRRIEGRDASRRIDRKIYLLLKFFFRALGLIQKRQKIKHGEK